MLDWSSGELDLCILHDEVVVIGIKESPIPVSVRVSPLYAWQESFPCLLTTKLEYVYPMVFPEVKLSYTSHRGLEDAIQASNSVGELIRRDGFLKINRRIWVEGEGKEIIAFALCWQIVIDAAIVTPSQSLEVNFFVHFLFSFTTR